MGRGAYPRNPDGSLYTSPNDSTGTDQPPTAPGNDLGQSKYKFDYMVFPSDLGMDQYGHYMVFNINVPTKGVRTNGLALNEPAGDLYRRNPGLFTPLNQVSKVDTLRFGDKSWSGGGQRSALNFLPRQTRRIAESIALYIPGGFSFQTRNDYQNISMTQFGAELLASGGTLAATIAGAALGGAPGALGGFFGGNFVTGIIGDTAGTLGSVGAVLGNPINPSIEILFTNVAQREFEFTFLMAPRNEIESVTIKKIIKTIRYHGAPEINTDIGGLGAGLTWIPPAEFDITFMKHGRENTNMLRINTCVLTDAEVNYSPFNVHSTFRNGHPVGVILRLRFKELEPVHKARVLAGF